MNNKPNHFYLLVLFLLLNIISLKLSAQTDSIKVGEPPINIGDSVIVSDTNKVKQKATPFLVDFSDQINNEYLNGFSLTKKEIDFSDYRFSGNIISNLPFGILNDLGSLGSPSEPNLYNNGWGNFSLSVDNFSYNNTFNNAVNINNLQTETISRINMVPLTRGFLYGFINNPAALLIETNDTLKSKPITRLRYYQASNEEGFVDALFSARVLPKLALSIRLTNSSIDENYTNTSFGTWKFNFNSIYKISDSIFSKLDFYHLKLNTQINGGIDISQFDQSTQDELDIYSIEYPVVYNVRGDTTTQNNISTSIYGKLLPFGYTKLSFGFSESNQLFNSSTDSTLYRFDNYYKSLTANFEHSFYINNLSAAFNAGYQKYKINIEETDLKQEGNNYFSSLLLSYNLLNKKIKPSVFGKYSNYNEKVNNGFGIDILFKPIESLKVFAGYSAFDKAYSLLESQYISSTDKQSHSVFFTSVEFELSKLRTTLSYFNIKTKNNVLPVINYESTINNFSYVIDSESESNGINFNSEIELWNILATTNLNYYKDSKSLYPNQENIFTLNAGLFYVDTLYNDNLDLKTGFIFYLFDNSNYSIIDFQYQRTAHYVLSDNNVFKPNLQSVINDKMRVDFYLAGRIQDAATFYFIYENLLGNKYFVVPYYPMPEGGMRIGISWDFLD